MQRFWTCPGCHEQRRHFDPPPGFPLQKHFLHGGPNIHVCRITEIWQTDEGVLFNCQWYESRNVLEENDRVSPPADVLSEHAPSAGVWQYKYSTASHA